MKLELVSNEQCGGTIDIDLDGHELWIVTSSGNYLVTEASKGFIVQGPELNLSHATHDLKYELVRRAAHETNRLRVWLEKLPTVIPDWLKDKEIE